MKTAGELIQLNLKRLRAERGWTQEKLADKARISLNSIQRIEARIRFPREDNISALAAAFEVPEAALFQDLAAAPALANLALPSPPIFGEVVLALTALKDDQLRAVQRFIGRFALEAAARSGQIRDDVVEKADTDSAPVSRRK